MLTHPVEIGQEIGVDIPARNGGVKSYESKVLSHSTDSQGVNWYEVSLLEAPSLGKKWVSEDHVFSLEMYK